MPRRVCAGMHLAIIVSETRGLAWPNSGSRTSIRSSSRSAWTSQAASCASSDA